MVEILIGFTAGIAAAFVGTMSGSGGLVSLSALIFMGFPTATAIATNRLAAIGGSVGGLARYSHEKRVYWKFGLILCIPSVTGAIAGANVVVNTSERLLEIILATVLMIMMPLIFFSKRAGFEEQQTTSLAKIVGLFSYFAYGFLAGLFGTGIGVIAIVVLTQLFGKTYTQAIATNLVSWFALSIVASIIFATNNLIEYRVAIAMGIGMIIGGWFGARLAVKKGENFVRILLLTTQILVIAKLLFF